MISSGDQSKDFPSTFLPHQIAFLETALDPTSKRMIHLRADVGLGKLATLVALVNQLFRERPKARVLFVVDPTVLRLEFEYRLRKANIPTLLFDRYRFRAMLDSITGQIIWPSGKAVVLSLDFAKQPDIRDSLAETHWDLVIVDEQHLLKGARAKAFQKIIGSADRVVLATGLATELPHEYPVEDTTLVEWRRYQIVDHDGKPLETVPPILHEIPFTLTAAELALRATVNRLCDFLGDSTLYDLDEEMLLQLLESSPAALEDALQLSIEDPLMLEEAQEGLPEGWETGWHEEGRPEECDDATIAKTYEIAEHARQELDFISDSKLSAFDELLHHLSGSKMQQKRICVCTQFVDTLYYLSAEIEGHDMTCLLLHGEMGAADRHHSLKIFSEGQKILVATTAVTEGVNLQKVTDLILYDIPNSKTTLQQLLSRFDRFGRSNQLHIYTFVPSNSSDSFIAESMALLRDLLADQARPAPVSK